ncbi:hypothetical protein JCM15519_07660 [Fundidesulfovibrio butyratiphilus]
MRRFPAFAALILLCCLLASVCLLQAAEINPGDVLLTVLGNDYPPQTPLLPEGTKVVTQYRELSDNPVGSVDFVQNEAYVLHADDKTQAYKAEKAKPVYAGDTLVAGANSRMVVLMNDKSQFSMASLSKVTLDKTVYDANEGKRDTVVGLAEGKARFVVQKLGKGQDNDFQVQTPLAVIGVRGSDFVVAIVPEKEIPNVTRSAGKPTSFLDLFRFVGTAHAQSTINSSPNAPQLIINPGSSAVQINAAGVQQNTPTNTVVLSGANTNVGVTGFVGGLPTTGAPVIVRSFQVTTVSPAGVTAPPVPVTPQQVPGVLNRVGTPTSGTSMPSVFE